MEQVSPPGRRKHFWIGIAVSLICLGAIFIFIKPAEIIGALGEAHFDRLIITALSIALFLALRAVRWRFMLKGGYSSPRSVPYKPVFHIQNVGYMFSNILPFRLGDVARAVLIGNVPPVTISIGLSTMIAERVFDLLFFVLIFPFVLATVSQLPTEVQTAVRAAGVLTILAVIILVLAANQRSRAITISRNILDRISFLDSERWIRRLDDLLVGLQTLTSWRDGLTLALLSILVWLPIFVGYFFGMLAVNLDPSPLEAIFVVCIAAFSVTAPSSPGQIGVFEAAVTFALISVLDMPKAEAASFAILYHIVNYLVIGILGVIGIFSIGATFKNILDSTRDLIKSNSS